jgi:hypothetical protein
MELYLRLPCAPTKAGHGVTSLNISGYTAQKDIICKQVYWITKEAEESGTYPKWGNIPAFSAGI